MDTPNTGLLPASCIFAGELMHAAEAETGFTTPFGIFSPEIFLIGTLAEKILRDDKISSLRIPSARPMAGMWATTQPAPNQSSTTAIARRTRFRAMSPRVGTKASTAARTSGDACRARDAAKATTPMKNSSRIAPSTREARDAWIVSTAESAIPRLENSPPSDLRKEVAGKISAALSSVRPPGPKEEVTNEKILDIISSLSEKKGARILDVIARLSSLGLDEKSAKMRLGMLMEEGECYTPTTEFIKIA